MHIKAVIVAAFGILALTGCETDEPAAPIYKRTVEPKSGLALITPPRYEVTPTYKNGLAGFRLVDSARETLAAVVETSSGRLSISPPYTGQAFASESYGRTVMQALLDQMRKNFSLLMPGVNIDESAGDYSIVTEEISATRDRHGRHVVYGRFTLQFLPIYQITSIHMFQYMALTLFDANWRGYPKNTKNFFPAGSHTLRFQIGVSLHDEESAFDSDGLGQRIGIAIATTPDNRAAELTIADLAPVIAFKTLGNFRDTLVKEQSKFEVGERGAPVDFVVAIDANGTMVQESAWITAALTDMLSRIATESTYDYHIALVSNESESFLRFQDGTRFISPDSDGPEALLKGAFEEIFAKANGTYFLRNNLLHSAALAVTTPASSGINAGFRRNGAPLLLFYISDRDDDSKPLSGTAFAGGSDFGVRFSQWLRSYAKMVLVFPSKAGCVSTGLDTAGGGAQLFEVSLISGASTYDMCSLAQDLFVREVLGWGDSNGSIFTFPVPQPIPFTIGIRVNGKAIKSSGEDGFVYDIAGDRLLFSGAKAPSNGDVVRASYLTLKPIQAAK